MSDDTFYVVACKVCDATMEFHTVATEWIDGKAVAWEHRCATCGSVFGIMLDGGTIDLGDVRESSLRANTDIELFTDRPWNHD